MPKSISGKPKVTFEGLPGGYNAYTNFAAEGVACSAAFHPAAQHTVHTTAKQPV